MENPNTKSVGQIPEEISSTPEQISLPVGVSFIGTLLPKEKSEFEISLEKKLGGGSNKNNTSQKCTFEVEKRTNRDPLDTNIYSIKITTEGKNASWKKNCKIQIHAIYEGRNIELTGKVIDIFPMRVTGTSTTHETWISANLQKIEKI